PRARARPLRRAPGTAPRSSSGTAPPPAPPRARGCARAPRPAAWLPGPAGGRSPAPGARAPRGSRRTRRGWCRRCTGGAAAPAAAPTDLAPAPAPGTGRRAGRARGCCTAPDRAAGRRARRGGSCRPPRRAPRAYPVAAEMAGEGAAAPDLAVDLQPCLVQAEHVLDDRQAEAGAALLARAAGRDPVEALGQARQVVARDAEAGVGHREYRAAARAARERDGDAPALGGVAHRVADQVGEGTVQFAR